MKKSEKLAAIYSSPTLQIWLWIVALFEKIYDEKPILSVFSVIGEDGQYRFSKVYYVKSVSQPDIDSVLQTIIDFK
jgi:hypothetical protein